MLHDVIRCGCRGVGSPQKQLRGWIGGHVAMFFFINKNVE